mmetsp:Transcript_2193/g.8600  ORF Transcript_2193/g.8600 Transcript_2193/m.8600 type:complete len:227 (+) Transcript_2193:1676-2356(+)
MNWSRESTLPFAMASISFRVSSSTSRRVTPAASKSFVSTCCHVYGTAAFVCQYTSTESRAYAPRSSHSSGGPAGSNSTSKCSPSVDVSLAASTTSVCMDSGYTKSVQYVATPVVESIAGKRSPLPKLAGPKRIPLDFIASTYARTRTFSAASNVACCSRFSTNRFASRSITFKSRLSPSISNPPTQQRAHSSARSSANAAFAARNHALTFPLTNSVALIASLYAFR